MGLRREIQQGVCSVFLSLMKLVRDCVCWGCFIRISHDDPFFPNVCWRSSRYRTTMVKSNNFSYRLSTNLTTIFFLHNLLCKFSWIHVDDLVNVIYEALTKLSYQGNNITNITICCFLIKYLKRNAIGVVGRCRSYKWDCA